MPRADRASQFMPFAALKGFDDALRAKEKIYVEKMILSEDTMAYLDYQLSTLHVGEMVTVIYYEAGSYLKKTGLISRIKKDARYITVVTTDISFENILKIIT